MAYGHDQVATAELGGCDIDVLVATQLEQLAAEQFPSLGLLEAVGPALPKVLLPGGEDPIDPTDLRLIRIRHRLLQAAKRAKEVRARMIMRMIMRIMRV